MPSQYYYEKASFTDKGVGNHGWSRWGRHGGMYALSNLPKKEDDLYHILNLACYSATGHYLPADGEVPNIHKYLTGYRSNSAIGRIAITPLRPSATIMEHSSMNHLSQQVKRRIICDSIKKLVAHNSHYYNLYKGLKAMDILRPPRYVMGVKQDNPKNFTFSNLTAYNWDRTKKNLKDKIKNVAYEVIMGEHGDEMLNFLQSNRKVDMKGHEQKEDLYIHHLFQTELNNHRFYSDKDYTRETIEETTNEIYTQSLGEDEQLVPQNQGYSISQFSGGLTPLRHNFEFNATKRIDHFNIIDKMGKGLTNKKGVGKEFVLTRSQKVRKGMETEAMRRFMNFLPYASGQFRHSRVDTFGGLHNGMGRIKRRFSMACNQDYDDGTMNFNSWFRPEWEKYKKDSGDISSSDMIRCMVGKGNVNERVGIKYRLCEMYC